MGGVLPKPLVGLVGKVKLMKYRLSLINLLLVALLLIGILLAGIVTVQGQNTVCNWYYKRAANHAQPTLDPNFSFIQNYGGYYILPNTTEKVVFLTFDAGYENGNVEKILDTLKAESVPGAFFLLSHFVSANTALVKRMFAEGHTVCNHTATHKDYSCADEAALRADLEKLEALCLEKTGSGMSHYFRPPEGRFSEQMMKSLHHLGYKTIFWSFAYADWDNQRQPDANSAKKKILDNIHPGAVLLLHPTSSVNAQILGDVIRQLKAEGYRFGTLDELTAS